MLRYFVAGNVWLLVALLAFVGRTSEQFVRDDPAYEGGQVMYSALGLGAEFSEWGYLALLASLLCLSVAFFVLAARTSKPPSPRD